MKHTFSLLMVLFVFLPSASAQPVAERVLSERGYLPGTSFKVILNVPAITVNTTLVEIPPQGWEISNLLASFISDDGRINIPLRVTPKPRTFTYLLTSPPQATGDYSFSGNIEGIETIGMTTVSPMVPEPIGIFENHIDLGIVEYNKTSYDSMSDVYTIEVGFSPDFFYHAHFLYRQVNGDCMIQCHAESQNADPENDYETVVSLGIHDDLRIDSPWFGVERKSSGDLWYGWGVGCTNLQRGTQVAWPPFFDGGMRIERQGDAMRAYYFDLDLQEWASTIEHTMDFEDPVYIGIQASCYAGNSSVGTFNEVVLTYDSPSSISCWEIY